MEKTIIIDGKEVALKVTAAMPIRYKKAFGTEYLADVDKLAKGSNLNDIDISIYYNLIWVMAKTADKTIPDLEAWLDSFDSFPLNKVLPEVTELLQNNNKTSSKN